MLAISIEGRKRGEVFLCRKVGLHDVGDGLWSTITSDKIRVADHIRPDLDGRQWSGTHVSQATDGASLAGPHRRVEWRTDFAMIGIARH